MKLSKENIKQISLIITGFLLIGVGYFNHNFDFKENNMRDISKRSSNEINLGDVELVNAEPDSSERLSDIVPNDEILIEKDTKLKEINQNEKEENGIKEDNYFQETRLEREKMYSEMISTYEKIIQNESTPSDQKAIAAQEISNITNIKNGIMISENLIKNKGFEEVIILVNNDTASVVVKSYNLNQEQISKIQNIIQRELKIEIKNINISNKI